MEVTHEVTNQLSSLYHLPAWVSVRLSSNEKLENGHKKICKKCASIFGAHGLVSNALGILLWAPTVIVLMSKNLTSLSIDAIAVMSATLSKLHPTHDPRCGLHKASKRQDKCS
jgi:hypothetical protein